MLNRRVLEDRTYEDLMEEALMQIPRYSSEWTNFNQSDPGITILENLSAFELLQQAYINKVPDEVKSKLLKMAGFEALPGKSARVLLGAEHAEEDIVIPANQRFLVGDVSFETNRQIEMNSHRLTAVYGCKEGELLDASILLEREIPVAISVFGQKPSVGDSIYLVMDGLPEEDELVCYIELKSAYHRTLLEDISKNRFARIRWQCYTEAGFTDIRCRDYTGGLLESGEIRFTLPKESMSVCSELPESGYVIRGLLERAEYDIAPKVSGITGFLFEAWQKETQSVCYTYPGQQKISVFCDLLEQGYYHIYCMEKPGGSYYRYQILKEGQEGQGRVCRQKRYDYGMYEFSFPSEVSNSDRKKLPNGIKLVAYSEMLMRRYYLDTVYGYDDQIIMLPITNIVPESFSVIAERFDEQGEAIYDFIKPGRKEEGALCYELFETEGRIKIIDAGDFIEARLYLCSSAVTKGEEGNIGAGKVFTPVGYESGIQFFNPGPGTGGRYKEQLEDVRKRFVNDVNRPSVLVTAADYEAVIKEVPGLLIHKVKAVFDNAKTQVTIAVKPYSEQEFPRLSENYRKIIEGYLEKRRLLSTKIILTGPVYLPVNIQGMIYVKRHYYDCREQIEEAVVQFLDYRMTERQFGEVLRFNELYQKIERLECVQYIHEISVIPQYADMAAMSGDDIIPTDNCLCYPGRILLEIRTADR